MRKKKISAELTTHKDYQFQKQLKLKGECAITMMPLADVVIYLVQDFSKYLVLYLVNIVIF